MTHPRVAHGSVAQQVAQAHLLECYQPCHIISTAVPGSKAPDIIANINGARIQCEVKSSFNFNSPVVTINKTVKRRNINIVDDLVPVMTDSEWQSIEEIVDYHRLTDETIGFPGDRGTPNSGKLPKCLKIMDQKLLRKVRRAVISNLRSRGDTYFILVCKRPVLTSHIFYTGIGKNVLNAPPLPQLCMAKLRTYGTARRSSMRVALKVSFVLP